MYELIIGAGDVGLRVGLANTSVNAAFVRVRRGDTETAYQNLQRALRIGHEYGDLPIVLEALLGFARYYFETGRMQKSVRHAQSDPV